VGIIPLVPVERIMTVRRFFSVVCLLAMLGAVAAAAASGG
jgi:hypothetical protein